jgi:hypothetical protein
MSAASEYKRTIPELVSQSKFATSLKTILVEGTEDKRVYSQYFQSTDNKAIAFLPINFVEIELPEQGRQGAGSGNRARVIEAAVQLSQSTADKQSICCITDTDLGFLLPKGPDLPDFLFYTDVTCLELYYYNEVILKRFIQNCCGIFTINTSTLLMRIASPLKEMMSIRLSLTENDLPVGWIENPKLTILDNGDLKFDWVDYLRRILSKSNNLHFLARITDRCTHWQNILKAMENPKVMHGHDFVGVLRWYLRSQGIPNKFLDQVVFFRILSVCGTTEDLAHYQIFKDLTNFCSSLNGVSPESLGSVPAA